MLHKERINLHEKGTRIRMNEDNVDDYTASRMTVDDYELSRMNQREMVLQGLLDLPYGLDEVDSGTPAS